MQKTREQLFDHLADLGIETTTVEHAPAFTVDDSKAFRGELPGAHCKNLFLKDKKGDIWLVVTLEDRAIDMKGLRHLIGSNHLSFGKPELLMEILGITPGSVTPFALINDRECRVNVVLDKEMMTYSVLNYHPLVNDATTAITPDDLMIFIRSCGHDPAVVAL
ncbi:MAG: prolyl-tRNA synthetase associated domain-containing protein [Alphaproteobacteria bacterium]|nr:prolyl-tRNA synthetase associated domain-containing protein [Alphaproteobacteria bacterium]